MAAPPLLLRSRVSSRHISTALRCPFSKKAIGFEAPPLAPTSRRVSRIQSDFGGSDVDVAAPQRDCFGSPYIDTLRAVSKLGIDSARCMHPSTMLGSE
ncbi:hypothetical protein ACMD2_05353 [Ananas comosus]|uniref:Uncharacterized protein n=1 Tax=Ananas comosus TaxID=4615 RepID=A0A199VU27_ANACO|nr:hypothetical protein ACMD2_05353 [Ananas comosus]